GSRRGDARASGGRRCIGGGPPERTLGRRNRRPRRTPQRSRRWPGAAARALHGTAGPVQGAQGIHLRRAGPSPGQRKGRLPLGENSSDREGADVDTNASRVIDCLVNVHFAETEKQPTWM